MAKSELFANLPDIEFAVRDPVAIESSIITGYERASGRSLAKGDPVRLFLETIALIIIQQRQIIDEAAKMNLLAYARGNFLDHIGAMVGTIRNKATSAICTLQFTFSAVSESARTIPAGTRASPDGMIYFAVDKDTEVPAGETTVTCAATCTVPGITGNGYLPGQINKIVDPLPYQATVKNISISANGSNIESDENFRERIQLAPESFSCAGSYGAYEYFARSADAGIIDVAVMGPSNSPDIAPGVVEIYPLMSGGTLPTPEILDKVSAVCSTDDVRPLTDNVQVKSPTITPYTVDLTYWIDRSKATSAATIQAQVQNAVSEWINWQRSKLGRDINPSALLHKIIEAGAKRADIRSPDFTKLDASQIAMISEAQSVSFGGLEDD